MAGVLDRDGTKQHRSAVHPSTVSGPDVVTEDRVSPDVTLLADDASVSDKGMAINNCTVEDLNLSEDNSVILNARIRADEHGRSREGSDLHQTAAVVVPPELATVDGDDVGRLALRWIDEYPNSHRCHDWLRC